MKSTECGGIEYFPNGESRTCDLCNIACKGCSGPTEFDCLICNENYVPTSKGNCIPFTCNADEYQDQNKKCQSNIIYIYIYIECGRECIGCRGPNDCISCQSWLFPIISESRVECIICENVSGYLTRTGISGERRCGEICGDGINLGEYECDDGNLEAGDGCDGECIQEDGFLCERISELEADKCKDLRPPTLDLNLEADGGNKTHQFKFMLSEGVMFTSTKDPKSFVQLAIYGHLTAYQFDYALSFYASLPKTTFLPGNNRQMPTDNNIQLYDIISISLIPLSTIIQNDVFIYIIHL